MRAAYLFALLQGAAAGGSWSPSQEISAGSHIHQLAAFSLTGLKQTCASSNSLVCSRIAAEASLLQVRSAQTQVVAGTNYLIEADTSAGNLHLKIFEQIWTNTLKVTEATLTLPSQGMSLAMVSGSLIEEELALDAAAFAALDRQSHCEGGKVWKECGSSCEPTCANASPMCMMMCVAKCECPQEKPLWENGACIERSECPAPTPVTTAAARPAAVEEPCTPHVGPCNRMYAPVCAGGRTYDNMCIARNACVKEEDTTPGRCILPGVGTPEIATTEAPAAAAPRPLMGGASATMDISPSSRVHKLAAFSFQSLQGNCAASNAIVCNGLAQVTFHAVTSATTQVVAGTVYNIEARTSAGTLHLRIFEQTWTPHTLEVSEAVLTRPVAEGLLGRANGDLLAGQPKLALDCTAFMAFVAARVEPLPTLSSAIMVGGALGLGGGHYTGSDQALLAAQRAPAGDALPIDKEEPTDQSPRATPPAAGTQWFIFGFFVLGVMLVVALAVISKQLQAASKSDEQPINLGVPRSSSAEVEAMDNLESQVKKGDASIA